jgi:hypothetical protein
MDLDLTDWHEIRYRSDIEMEPDKSHPSCTKKGRPRRGQNSFGHIEKPHFGVSIFWLSKWNRVRNVLLEVMPNWSRGWPKLHRIARNVLRLHVVSKSSHHGLSNFVFISISFRLVRFYIVSTSALLRSDSRCRRSTVRAFQENGADNEMVPRCSRNNHGIKTYT